MATDLTGTTPQNTYGQLLHVDGGVTGTLKTVYDGNGTATGLQISTTGIAIGDVSEAEISYLNGVTSAIQTQIDAKQATLVSGTNIKTINGTSLLGSGDLTVTGGSYTDEQAQDAIGTILTDSSEIDFTYDDATPSITATLKDGVAATRIADGSVSNTEFQYLNGVTSAIQTQIDGKAATSHTHAISDVTNLQTSLDAKQDTLVSGTSIKTINGTSLLGSGDVTVSGGSATGAIDFYTKDVRIGFASVNSVTLTLFGAGNPTATGTATAFTPDYSSTYKSVAMCEYLVTVASSSAVAGFRFTDTLFNVANGSEAYIVWGAATGQSDANLRAFVGLTVATTAPTDVDPSTLVNCIGMGWDDTDTNVQIFHNDGSGACTKIDLGASWEVTTTDRRDIFSLKISHDGTNFAYEAKRHSSYGNLTESGSITTNKPSNGNLLVPRGYCSAGGTSSVVGIGLNRIIVQQSFIV